MKRRFYLIAAILILSLCAIAFTACKPDVVEAKEFTVTVVGGVGGGVFKENDSCTVTATVEQDREFVEWQINGVSVSTDLSYVFTVTKDVTLTAVTKVKDVKPEPPAPSLDLGAFARKWVSKDGVLDLIANTWTEFSDFEIVSVEGKGGDMTVNCLVEGSMPYKLTLTGDGKLYAYDVEYPELNYTFMPSADRFNGVWQLQDDEIYALLISELNENGLFGWALIDSDGTVDEDFLITATTKLVFDDDGNASVQFVNAFNIVYEFNTDNNLVVVDEDLLYVPTADLFADCYVSKDGTIYKLDPMNGAIHFDGNVSRLTLQCGNYGVGLYFTREQSHYALIRTLDGVCLYSDNGYELLSPFAFAGSYTNGDVTLTVDEAMTVTIGSYKYGDGSLAVLKDLDRVGDVAPNGYAGLQQAAIVFDSGSKYLIWIKGGVAVATKENDNYVIQSAYYTSEALQDLQKQFLAGLDASTDMYTTGGIDRITVKPDFENSQVIINDVAVPFTWHYVIRKTGDEYAVMAFKSTISNAEYNCLLYPYFDYKYVRLETTPVGSTDKAVVRSLTSQALYMPLLGTSYAKQCDGYTETVQFASDGTLTLTRGAQGNVEIYYDYELTLDHTYNYSVLVVTFADNQPGAKFEVPIYCDNIGVSVTIVNDVYVNPIILDAIGVYCDADGVECLELLPNMQYKFNVNGIDGIKAQPFIDAVVEDGKLYCLCDEANYCVIVFSDGKATVTTADGEIVYAKKDANPPELEENDIIPEQFLGVYCNEEGLTFLQVLSDNMFLYDEIGDELTEDVEATEFDTVTIDGDTVTCTKTYKGLTSWTVTFVFSGNSVTVYYGNEAPVVYTKQS